VYLPLIDYLIQDMNDRLLSQEVRLIGQYLLPINLQGLSNDIQDKMYAGYKNDLTDKREYDNEVLRWKTKWLYSTAGERPATLADTLDSINPTLYRDVRTILTILLTMPCQPQLLGAVLARCIESRPGAIIGDGDRKRGVHAAPSKKTNVLFLEKIAPPSTP